MVPESINTPLAREFDPHQYELISTENSQAFLGSLAATMDATTDSLLRLRDNKTPENKRVFYEAEPQMKLMINVSYNLFEAALERNENPETTLQLALLAQKTRKLSFPGDTISQEEQNRRDNLDKYIQNQSNPMDTIGDVALNQVGIMPNETSQKQEGVKDIEQELFEVKATRESALFFLKRGKDLPTALKILEGLFSYSRKEGLNHIVKKAIKAEILVLQTQIAIHYSKQETKYNLE